MKKLWMMGILGLGFVMQAHAITINVNRTDSGCGATEAICVALHDALRTELNKDTPDVGVGKYADGVADATGFAMKGQTSDYAENFNYFVLKPSFGVGVRGDMNDAQSADGFGLGGALTVGLNLNLLPVEKIGPVELKKLDLFISFMNYNVDQNQDKSSFKGELSSFAILGRYRIMDGKDILPGYMLEWGGLHLHTGFQRNKMAMKLTQGFDGTTVDVDTGSGTGSVSLDGVSATFDLDSTVTSIPVEVSTYLRMLYVFTLYGGLGFDYTIGKSDIGVTANGSVNDGTSGYGATIDADESGDGKAKATNFRSFAGIQFNVPFVRVYAQMNKGLGSDLVGANFGIKVTY
jgi:hypothetical protein